MNGIARPVFGEAFWRPFLARAATFAAKLSDSADGFSEGDVIEEISGLLADFDKRLAPIIDVEPGGRIDFVVTANGVDEGHIRVIPCAVGGGFGGKSETFPADVACAVLARMTGRPVRIRLSRDTVAPVAMDEVRDFRARKRVAGSLGATVSPEERPVRPG